MANRCFLPTLINNACLMSTGRSGGKKDPIKKKQKSSRDMAGSLVSGRMQSKSNERTYRVEGGGNGSKY